MSLKIEKMLACLGIFLLFFSIKAQKNIGNKDEIRLVVSVTDKRGRYVGGLKAEDIQIIVEKKPQEITSFTYQEQPATIVFLIDLSGSRKGFVAPLAKEIQRFIRNANPSNEYMILAFNTKIQMVSDKTADIGKLDESLNKTLRTMPNGNTAFFDSVYAAIEKAESGKYQKKILIACSDGADTESLSYEMNDVVESLKQSDVLFYGLSYIKEENNFGVMNLMGQDNLERLSEISGGKSLFPLKETEISGIFDQIGLELKSQYQVGFRVTDFTKPDKWRELKVKVKPVLDGNKQVNVQARTRSGFYPTSAK